MRSQYCRVKQHLSDILHRHQDKLKQLYGNDVFLKQDRQIVVNLSSHTLDRDEEQLLSKGLNFGRKRKYNTIPNKIQMENLFYNIECKERGGEVTVENKYDLKTKLKSFGTRNCNLDSRTNVLSVPELRALKKLKNNPDVVIQRPDKGGGVVILDKVNYTSKLQDLLSVPG